MRLMVVYYDEVSSENKIKDCQVDDDFDILYKSLEPKMVGLPEGTTVINAVVQVQERVDYDKSGYEESFGKLDYPVMVFEE